MGLAVRLARELVELGEDAGEFADELFDLAGVLVDEGEQGFLAGPLEVVPAEVLGEVGGLFHDSLAGLGVGGEPVRLQLREAGSEVVEVSVAAEEEPDEVEDAALGARELVLLGPGRGEQEPDRDDRGLRSRSV